MTIRAKFECDGRGCFNEHEIGPTEPVDTEMMPDTWSWDSINDYHYCPSCKKKMIENGELEEYV